MASGKSLTLRDIKPTPTVYSGQALADLTSRARRRGREKAHREPVFSPDHSFAAAHRGHTRRRV